jgi:hypothetical protein
MVHQVIEENWLYIQRPFFVTRRWSEAGSFSIPRSVSQARTPKQTVPLNKTPWCPTQPRWVTSLRSAMVRLIPANCFHTGSARLRLKGLPVRMAMPSNTPDRSKHRERTYLKWMINCFLFIQTCHQLCTKVPVPSKPALPKLTDLDLPLKQCALFQIHLFLFLKDKCLTSYSFHTQD